MIQMCLVFKLSNLWQYISDNTRIIDYWHIWLEVRGLGGVLCRVQHAKNNWNQLDLKLCKNEGSKRSKINEKGGQLDKKSWRKFIQNA